jgi:hypothetical protein
MGFVYHGAPFSWDSLDVTLKRKVAEKIGDPISVVCHISSRPRRVFGGPFPYANRLTLVVDRSRLSRNFMWCRGTAIISPLLDKRTDVYK